jgi:phage gpG-like protein
VARGSLTGDFAKLEGWAKRIGDVGGAAKLKELSENLAEEALELVAQGFENERDPYGKKWQRKRFPDGRQVLVGKTARLRRGWHRKSVTAQGFQIAPAVNYAKYHQNGRGPITAAPGKMLRFMVGGKPVFRKSVGPAPARKMVPGKGRLPSAWRRSLLAVAKAFFTETFK